MQNTNDGRGSKGTLIGSMGRYQIILTIAVCLSRSQDVAAQQFAPGPPPPTAQVYPQTTAPPAVTVPATGPYLPTSPPMIQPAAVIAPVVPAPGTSATAVPLPSQTPGTIFGPPLVMPPGAMPPGTVTMPVPVSPLSDIAPGGLVSPQFGLPAGPEALPGPQNVIAVPVVDEELAWDQIADVVSDYFAISREQRARRGEAACEGRIETAPQVGATWLEPNRSDSVGDFNRWESTFQTIRRRALVRVIPDGPGYLVEVIVEKELEDLPRPEQATAGSATFIHDASLPSRRGRDVSRTRTSPRWIQLGRDPPLERRMLAEIHARLNGITTQTNPSLWQ